MTCSICKQDGHNKRSCRNTIQVSTQNESDSDIKIFPPEKLDMSLLPHVEMLKQLLSRRKVNHTIEVMKLDTLKEANIYCKEKLSGQKYGPLLEKFIREKFNYTKNKAKDCTGDCSKDSKNSEVKVSLGGENHKEFNFVQIRPSHNCDTYIFTAYHLSNENVEVAGELYIFKIPKSEIIKIVVSHGGYAHGTHKKLGDITLDSLHDEKKDLYYALRPKINDACWKRLLQFRVTETEL